MKRGIQARIAKMSGLSEAMISLILKGERSPKWDNAKILADITNTDVEIWMELDLNKIKRALERWNPSPRKVA